MKKHQKHAKIARPAYGQFSRNEWAIIGTPCGVIKQLSFDICQALSDEFRLGYVDADHHGADAEPDGHPQSAMAFGATAEYTDKISFHRLDFSGQPDSFQYRRLFNQEDAVIVNGNHFKAKQQIVVVDPRKEASLQKKLDRLTDVQLILLSDGVEEPFDFLKTSLPHFDQIPQLKIQETSAIIHFLRTSLKAAIPPLSGLVLAGGKSQRMGRDKGLIEYHGRPQREYLFDLLQPHCTSTYYSCRPGQEADFAGLPHLTDSFAGLGPYGAILSAFRQHPDHAWLVVAVDLPLLDNAALQQLTEGRNPSQLATAFHNPETAFPDPLITIWEPRAYPVLLDFLAQGYSCPRKVLINSSIEELQAENPAILTNVNSPEEMEEVKKKTGC